MNTKEWLRRGVFFIDRPLDLFELAKCANGQSGDVTSYPVPDSGWEGWTAQVPSGEEHTWNASVRGLELGVTIVHVPFSLHARTETSTGGEFSYNVDYYEFESGTENQKKTGTCVNGYNMTAQATSTGEGATTINARLQDTISLAHVRTFSAAVGPSQFGMVFAPTAPLCGEVDLAAYNVADAVEVCPSPYLLVTVSVHGIPSVTEEPVAVYAAHLTFIHESHKMHTEVEVLSEDVYRFNGEPYYLIRDHTEKMNALADAVCTALEQSDPSIRWAWRGVTLEITPAVTFIGYM